MPCCLAVLTDLRPALADAASDRAMATRYEQSAQAGDDDAQFYLGALHSAGVGRPRSDQEAFRWFSRATDQGHAHAMLIVAGLYASGRGITKDNVKAYSWAYIVASASKARRGPQRCAAIDVAAHEADDERRDRPCRGGRKSLARRSDGWRRQVSDISKELQTWTSPRRLRPSPPHRARGRAVSARSPAASPAVSQPASSNVTVLPAAPRHVGTSVKNAKRDDARELLDQVPPNLRKRFGF